MTGKRGTEPDAPGGCLAHGVVRAHALLRAEARSRRAKCESVGHHAPFSLRVALLFPSPFGAYWPAPNEDPCRAVLPFSMHSAGMSYADLDAEARR